MIAIVNLMSKLKAEDKQVQLFLSLILYWFLETIILLI